MTKRGPRHRSLHEASVNNSYLELTELTEQFKKTIKQTEEEMSTQVKNDLKETHGDQI